MVYLTPSTLLTSFRPCWTGSGVGSGTGSSWPFKSPYKSASGVKVP